VALRFITRHPDAVALDLGAGLDTRMFRIAPPATVDWYDIDFPEVITARQQLLPDRANAHGIGTDLTDPDWLVAIPTHRPAVIVADGLLAFLPQEDMISLLNRLISHVPSGEVAFNGYTRFAIWAAKGRVAPGGVRRPERGCGSRLAWVRRARGWSGGSARVADPVAAGPAGDARLAGAVAPPARGAACLAGRRPVCAPALPRRRH
jgi:O-methyltransferase involved in polyketide biosynthesis